MLSGVISGFVSVIFNAIMFSLPIPIVLSLNLERSKKIGLGLTFFSGILYVASKLLHNIKTNVHFSGIVASVIALYYKWHALYGDASQLVLPVFCL